MNKIDNLGKTTLPVLIVGGGITGTALARSLSKHVPVALVDPNEYFEVPMSVPRSLVQPAFSGRAIVPFEELLPGVILRRGHLHEMRRDAALISVLAPSGRHEEMKFRAAVLCTGSRYPGDLMRAQGARAEERREFYKAFNQRVSAARHVMIVGGGPIGVEVAGELRERYPEQRVTLVEVASRLLSGSSERAAAFATNFLRERGVDIRTGQRVLGAGPSKTSLEAQVGPVTTSDGLTWTPDLVLWCTGGAPITEYMKAHLADALDPHGRVRVQDTLAVTGQRGLFAMGDITDLAENKMAWHAGNHVPVVAHNVLAYLAGKPDSSYKRYKPKTGAPQMLVTLGSKAGVAELPAPVGFVTSPFLNRLLKAKHMLVPIYRRRLGLK